MTPYDQVTWPEVWPTSLRSMIYSLAIDQTRVRVTYEYGGSDVGYIGFTCGQIKSPIIVHNKRSMGGGLISSTVSKVESSKKGGKVYWDVVSFVMKQ